MKTEEFDDEPLPEDYRRLNEFLKSIYRPRQVEPDEVHPEQVQMAFQDEAMLNHDEPADYVPSKQAGERFGAYEILEFLKKGSFGEVYRALRLEDGCQVALKLPLSERLLSEAAYRRFKREPRFLKKLNHAGIVELLDFGLINQTFYIATRYEPGCDLGDWLERHGSEITSDLVVDWGMRLADALEHSYENGVVHRDLKPGNIIVVEDWASAACDAPIERRFRPKITDFGLAFSTQETMSGSTPSDTVLGTVGYIPPEQVMPVGRAGRPRGDIRGDIYALGIILAELALGRLLPKPERIIEYILNFNRYEQAVSLRPVRAMVRPELYAILRKCVETDPLRRYQRPGDLQDDLERVRLGLPIEMRRTSSRENLRRIVRRNPVLSISFLLSFMFMMVLIAGLVAHQSRLERSEALTRQTAYDADMMLGFSDWKEGRIEAAHDILDKTFRMEQDSKKPLRDLGWSYLQLLANRDFSSHQIKGFDLYLPGSGASKLAAMLQAYQNHSEENNLNFASPTYYQTGMKAQEPGNLSWLDEKYGASFLWRDQSGHWYFSRHGEKEFLAEPGRFDEIYCNAAGDLFYYMSSHDTPGAGSNLQVKVKKSTGRTSVYFNGFMMPAISLDGLVLSGLCRTQPGSGKLAWVFFDTKSGEMIQTGVEIPEVDAEKRQEFINLISQSGRFAALYLNDERGLQVFDRTNKNLIRLGLTAGAERPHGRTLAIDEVRQLVLAGDSSGNIHLYKMGLDEPLATFSKQMKSQTQVGFLPDGRCYANLFLSDRIWIWNPFEPKKRHVELDQTNEVWTLAFDASGQRLISAGDDRNVRLWDLNSGQGRIIGSATELVTRGRFSMDGSLFATCDYSGFLMIWRADNWKLLKNVKVSEQSLRSMAWSPDNQFLICVGKGDHIVEYHLKDDSKREYYIGTGTYDVVYSPYHNEFVVGMQDSLQKKLLFMKFPGGQIQAGLNPSRSPTRFAVDPKGERLAIGFNEGGFGVVNLKARSMQQTVDSGQSSNGVIDLIFTTDGRNVITTLKDRRALIYETVTWEKVGMMNDHDSIIHAIAFSPDGEILATGDMSGKIRTMRIPRISNSRQ